MGKTLFFQIPQKVLVHLILLKLRRKVAIPKILVLFSFLELQRGLRYAKNITILIIFLSFAHSSTRLAGSDMAIYVFVLML